MKRSAPTSDKSTAKSPGLFFADHALCEFSKGQEFPDGDKAYYHCGGDHEIQRRLQALQPGLVITLDCEAYFPVPPLLYSTQHRPDVLVLCN